LYVVNELETELGTIQPSQLASQSEWHSRQQKSAEKWSECRPDIFLSVVCAASPPQQQICHICDKHAVIR